MSKAPLLMGCSIHGFGEMSREKFLEDGEVGAQGTWAGWGERDTGCMGGTNVCIECIGQCTRFVCSNRTRKTCSFGSYKSCTLSAPIYTALFVPAHTPCVPPSPAAHAPCAPTSPELGGLEMVCIKMVGCEFCIEKGFDKWRGWGHNGDGIETDKGVRSPGGISDFFYDNRFAGGAGNLL